MQITANKVVYGSFRAAATRIASGDSRPGDLALMRIEAPELFAIFDHMTVRHADSIAVRLHNLRIVVLSGLLLIALVAFLLLRFLVTPTHKRLTQVIGDIEEQRQRFTSIFELSPDPMALYNTQGILLRANAAASNLLGFDETSIGSQYSKHVALEMQSSVAACFARARGGKSIEFESLFVSAGQRKIPVLATLSPIRVGGEIVGVFGVAKDLTELRATEAAMLRSESEFRSLFNFNHDGGFATDLDSRIIRVNTALDGLLGRSTDVLLFSNARDLFVEDQRSEFDAILESIVSAKPSTFDFRVHGPGGHEIDVLVRAIPMFAEGKLQGAFYFLRDVTELRAAEQREAVQRERLGAVALLAAAHAIDVNEQIERTLAFSMASFHMDGCSVSLLEGDEVVVVHAQGEIPVAGTRIALEKTFTRHVVGSSDPFCINDIDVSDLASDSARDWQPWRSIIGATIFVGGFLQGVVLFVARSPRLTPFDDGDKSFVQVVASLVGSAMERDRQQQKLSELALTDALTGLPNRPALHDALRGAVARARRSEHKISLLYFDLDGFKAVNDSFGHTTGDKLLHSVALRLQAILREGDFIARVGGDEFVIVRADAPEADGGRQLAERIVASLGEPFDLGGTFVEIGASVGVAIFPDNANSATELVRVADEAMYVAKAAGKGRVAASRREGEAPTA